jgi:lipid-A-disaccharide synthase
MENKVPSFFLIAGEASGDVLGSRLIHALKAEFGPDISISGIGGPAMMDAGLPSSLFPMEDLSLMGIFEIAPSLVKIRKRIDKTVKAIRRTRPDVLITIDAPDFCFRVAKRIKLEEDKTTPKIVHYVAPSVWAWRKKRAKKIARFLDGLLCLLPFEPPYFEKEGLRAEFIGHPMIEAGALTPLPDKYRKDRLIPEEVLVVGLLPGSRKGEIKTTGTILSEAVQILCDRYKDIHVVIPTWPHLEDTVRALSPGFAGATVHIDNNQSRKFDAFASCNIALATSGTVGLELAVTGVPHLIAYKMNPVTWKIIKKVVRVKYAHLANIILDRSAVPEFIQSKCEAGYIAEKAFELLENAEMQADQYAAFREVRKAISGGDNVMPSQKAARFIKDIINS